MKEPDKPHRLTTTTTLLQLSHALRNLVSFKLSGGTPEPTTPPAALDEPMQLGRAYLTPSAWISAFFVVKLVISSYPVLQHWKSVLISEGEHTGEPNDFQQELS